MIYLISFRFSLHVDSPLEELTVIKSYSKLFSLLVSLLKMTAKYIYKGVLC
jgi:hypothetical protein